MNLIGADAIRQMGVTYMSGMSEQIASHFGTIIELRLSQVSGLAGAVPPARFTDRTPLQIEMTYNARAIGFEYLAFYTEDGRFQMIYGSQVTADVPEAMHRSVQSGRYNVCAGRDGNGTPVVLMGIPAAYSMPGGETSIALVAGLPTSYLIDTLESNIKGNMAEYFVIRDNGDYVFQNNITEEDNYFEHIENSYEPYEGRDVSWYAAKLKDALEQDQDYTDEVMISGERWHIYCTNLPNSEWHLLLKMSYDTSGETIHALEGQWSFISLGGCGLILVALLLAFAGYFRLLRKQMVDLDEARRHAEH